MTNQPPDWFHFWQRPFPSANTLLIEDEKPVLIDSGFGRDVPALLRWLQRSAVAPERLWLLVNTHYHSDHVGGNAHLQSHFQIPIAAHRWEGQLINNHDPEAWSARFLQQPVEPYHVDQFLEDGEELVTGKHALRVVHTPGHTLGHLSCRVMDDCKLGPPCRIYAIENTFLIAQWGITNTRRSSTYDTFFLPLL